MPELKESVEVATYGLSSVGSLDLSNDGKTSDATLILQCRVIAGDKK